MVADSPGTGVHVCTCLHLMPFQRCQECTSATPASCVLVLQHVDAPCTRQLQQHMAVINACRWNDSVNLPTDPTFHEALQAWQRDVERGLYAPKLLGSITAVSSGRVKTAAGTRRTGSSPASPLSRSAARRPTCHTTTIVTSTAVDGAGAAGASSAPRCSRSSDDSGAAAVTPAVFHSGENALQALEGLVVQHLVVRPRLTLMQLQRAVQGISQLDSPCQLAAISVLVKAGFWLAAMQVRHCANVSWRC